MSPRDFQVDVVVGRFIAATELELLALIPEIRPLNDSSKHNATDRSCQ